MVNLDGDILGKDFKGNLEDEIYLDKCAYVNAGDPPAVEKPFRK